MLAAIIPFVYIYQLTPIQLAHLILHYNFFQAILGTLIIAAYFSLQFWIYKKLTSKAVVLEAVEANVSYQPLWHY